MATRFNLRDTTVNIGSLVRTEKSTTLPVGTLDDNGFAAKDLSRTAGSVETSYAGASLAQTAQQSQYFTKWISEGLVGVTSLAANTWSVRLKASEGNGAANAFVRVSIYVLTSADAVRGFVYDGTADLGAEVSGAAQDYTVSGSAVSSIVDTDRLVVEVWLVASQTMATAYTNTVFYDSAADSYIETPENIFPPSITAASASDSGRDWTTPFQDISVTFSEAVEITPAPSVGDTIAGLTLQQNGGANQALTYRSGNTTTGWVVRAAVLAKNGETLVLDYARASGIMLSMSGTEVAETTDAAVTNNLTKRIRETIKNAAGTALNAVTVKYGVFQYDSGAPANANWMTRDQKGTVATSAAGVLDIEYTGAAAVGGTAYVVVIQPDTTPTEAMIWPSTVT